MGRYLPPAAPLPRPRRLRRLGFIFILGLGLAGAACAPALRGPFVWVDEWQETAAPKNGEGYVIGVGDLLDVQVWDQEKMSGRVRVRSDGRISVPFLNDVPVVGMTPVTLARDLEKRLREFIVTPQVTVVVEEAKPLSVSVLGQVGQPGLYNLDAGARVAQALAAAGGLKDFAHKDRIFLLRGGDKPARIRMTYEAVTEGDGPAASLRLRSGDVVVVE
ncbi:MAG: polysaccharide biosynthesis/export family protein [Acidobacteria bacterium]|nr:polysaccharide biosynthesis/export family protein [Acidobacteriota bacterium]